MKPTAKPKPATISLADVTITWQDGERTHEVPGADVALALAFCWRLLNNGHGTFDTFHDREMVDREMFAQQELASALAIAGEAGEVPAEAFDALSDHLGYTRARAAVCFWPPEPAAFTVHLAPAPAA